MEFDASHRVRAFDGRIEPGRRARRILLLTCGLSLSAVVHAQTPPPTPPQPVAPTREEIDRRDPGRPELPPARLTVEGGIQRAPCALDRPEYRDIRFTLTGVAFEDLQGLAPGALRPAYADLLGTEVSVAAICEIRDRAATMLREAGYIASVEVPEQRIADGSVRFRVLMARLVDIRVRGDAGRSERLIASYLEGLARGQVFNRFEAERYLLLARDLPGYNVRLALRSAGGAPGEVIGEVTVVRIPGLVDFNVQNFGSKSLGRWGGMLRGQLFGLTGLGDRTSLAVFTTADLEEQQTLQVAHDFRVGGEGLTLGGQFTYAWASPDIGDPNVDFDARTLFATIEASYPFLLRRSESVSGAIGFDLIDQHVDFNGIPFSRDRLRVAFARLDFEAADVDEAARYSIAEPRWRLAGSVELRQGLDVLGASDACGPALANCAGPGVVPPSRLEGDPTATLIRSALAGEVRPVPGFTLAAAARAQHSGDPLLSFEEFSAGNYTVGRGYDPGTLLGDSGLAFQIEARIGSAIPDGPDRFAAEPFVFLDQAWVWNEDRLFALPAEQELTSVGGGVRASYGGRFRLEALVAVPLDRGPLQSERGDPRFLLSFTTRLWPWSLR